MLISGVRLHRESLSLRPVIDHPAFHIPNRTTLELSGFFICGIRIPRRVIPRHHVYRKSFTGIHALPSFNLES